MDGNLVHLQELVLAAQQTQKKEMIIKWEYYTPSFQDADSILGRHPSATEEAKMFSSTNTYNSLNFYWFFFLKYPANAAINTDNNV